MHSITYAIRNYYTEYLIGQSPFNLESSLSLALESARTEQVCEVGHRHGSL